MLYFIVNDLRLCPYARCIYFAQWEKGHFVSFILEQKVLFCLESSSFILVDSGSCMSLFLEMVKFLAPNLNQVLEEKVPMQLHSISNCIKSWELKIEVASELRRKVVRRGWFFLYSKNLHTASKLTFFCICRPGWTKCIVGIYPIIFPMFIMSQRV